MGLDLTLVPLMREVHTPGRPHLAYTRIELQRRGYELKDRLKPRVLGELLMWYGDEGLETVSEDPYGNPLTYVLVDELADAMEELDLGSLDLATQAYFRLMPYHIKVVLWWH
jgi:hypothetical protein